MKFDLGVTTSIIIGGFVFATPAAAAPLLFNFTGQTLTGPATASFQLDSNPTPSRINDQPVIGSSQIFFDNVSGIFNSTAGTSSISFGTNLISQFQFSGPSGSGQFAGPTIFSGPLTSPVFSPGTFQFTGFFSSGTLTVSNVAAAVPEPATWAMMIGGFGTIGGAMRYRRRKTQVSFA